MSMRTTPDSGFTSPASAQRHESRSSILIRWSRSARSLRPVPGEPRSTPNRITASAAASRLSCGIPKLWPPSRPSRCRATRMAFSSTHSTSGSGFSVSQPNATVIDAKDGSIVGTLDLGGAPEQAVTDGKGHLYVDLEDKDKIAAVDAKTLKVTAQYDLAGK